jgi:hypothetical protein
VHRTGSSTGIFFTQLPTVQGLIVDLAVTIILFLIHPNGRRSVVLNEEWRAPINNICVGELHTPDTLIVVMELMQIGWPGGLVDEGEDIKYFSHPLFPTSRELT